MATPPAVDPEEMGELEGREQIEDIAEEGAAEMIQLDDDETFSSAHKLYALIYEFRAEGEENVEVRRPSPVNATAHLTRSGIYPELDEQD